MIRSEYLRFLQTLTGGSASDDVRRIANLVLQYLDELIPLSTAHGQRIKKIVPLAQENWGTTSTNIRPASDPPIELTLPITQLKSLSVGPFRGFAKQEIFDLSSKLVLIYGPNGSGKSSFCEALEYALLENVAEAESKRFRNQQDYLKNAHTNTFTVPELIGISEEGQEGPIEAHEARYRFCFVEKNRIDSFSRIAAQVPARQTELISTLFGLEAFNEFARNFTTEIDDRYIDLEGIKAKHLNEKREALAGYKQQLESIPGELEKLDEEEQTLAAQYREDISFAQMVMELNGDEENPGAIKSLETEIQKPTASKNNLTVNVLQDLKESVQTKITNFTAKQQELMAASQQVSFKQLFEAVSQVQKSSPEHCPACKTPITQAVVNPYTYADEELKKLQHLVELEQTIKKLSEKIRHSLTALSQIINTCCARFPKDNHLLRYQIQSEESVNDDWWHSLNQQREDGFIPLLELAAQVKQLENDDKATDQEMQQRSKKQSELTRLRVFAEEIVRLQTRKDTANKSKEKAKKTIETFDSDNSKLIADVEHEKVFIARNKRIADGYMTFVDKLNSYKDSLPAQLIEDLGEKVVSLYNAFNRNDSIDEHLSAIRLPLAQNQRLEISFQNDPTTFFDALHVLSEGHIRCIGLAILLAKNLKENCSILIFDDPVNAIDDDHRESIRKTLFEDSFFNGKQIILTCHGEEFFKDIQNLLSVERIGQSKTLSFLPKLGEQHIRIDFNCAPRNYIIAAITHHNRNEFRDALAKSRQALESLAKGKVWGYVNKHGDGNLSIKLRSPTAPMELRNLIEQLKIKIANGGFSDPNKCNILTPIEKLLGINGDSREWRYLNKGIHDEVNRAEFDRHTIKEIITALEQLDDALG
jgi:DNA sulfur modification protein DndD